MDDPTPLGRLELIERDETGNITAVITEGPGGGKINVAVSFRSRISASLLLGRPITRRFGTGTILRLWPLTGRAGTRKSDTLRSESSQYLSTGRLPGKRDGGLRWVRFSFLSPLLDAVGMPPNVLSRYRPKAYSLR